MKQKYYASTCMLIFVHGHYLSWVSNSFPRVELKERMWTLRNSNVKGQIFEPIFTQNLLAIFRAHMYTVNWVTFRQITCKQCKQPAFDTMEKQNWFHWYLLFILLIYIHNTKMYRHVFDVHLDFLVGLQPRDLYSSWNSWCCS